jgi:hypothetical protein
MSLSDTTPGRGAWTSTAKGNRSRHYEHIPGTPLDGASAQADLNHLAVNLGVKAIQARINSLGYEPKLQADGVLGAKTGAGIKWVQAKLNLRADGRLGPATAQRLWRDYVTWFAAWRGAPPAHLHGLMSAESNGDPGAVGYLTPSDLGLFQINIKAHTYITPEQAFDPVFSTDYTARRLAEARRQFSGKGVALQTNCSIAQHNAPAWARQWYQDGYPPNERIAQYVAKILELAKAY